METVFRKFEGIAFVISKLAQSHLIEQILSTICVRPVARGGQGAAPVGKKFGKISHKNRENQGKWEEKGKIGKKMGRLPGACPCGPEGLATALFACV